MLCSPSNLPTVDETHDQHPEHQVNQQSDESKEGRQVIIQLRGTSSLCKYYDKRNMTSLTNLDGLDKAGSTEARAIKKENKNSSSLYNGLRANNYSWWHLPILASRYFRYCRKKKKKEEGLCLFSNIHFQVYPIYSLSKSKLPSYYKRRLCLG